MADALISFVLENLNSMVQQELGLLMGATGELEKLSSTFKAIRATLKEAESRQVKEESIKDWLGKLKDVAYDVDDVLDEWKAEILRLQINRGRSETSISKNKVDISSFSPCLCYNQAVFRHKVGYRIKKIRKRLDEIRDEKNSFLFREDREEWRLDTEERMTGSLIDESEIYGRNPDRERIVNWLAGESTGPEEDLPVISIVGMGGIGKTTLAQLVYNDERVKEHFDKRMWVSVSHDFDVRRICEAIMEADRGFPDRSFCEWETLQGLMTERLKGKQFLLVLDDVWNENEVKWEKLRLPLKGGAKGSRILVTTRSQNVGKKMGTTQIHCLEQLYEDDCWSLFSRRAFAGKTREECLELEEIGMRIVDRCEGVPLAAKTMGSVMRSKTTKWEWENVLQSKIWDLPEVAEGILPALLLSYYNMPLHLKQCFAFCSIFPKDHLLEKDLLIKLWMAEGFVLPEGRGEMERIGGLYFEDLMGRSLFDDIVTDIDGNITHCKMRGAVHDLSRFIMNEHLSAGMESSNDSHVNARHSSLIFNPDVTSIPPSLYKAKNLRTLLFIGWSGISDVPRDLFHTMRCIRVLDLSGTKIKRLPNSIKSLVHLRFLNMSATEIEELPESVSSLYFLQTLKLNECRKLWKVPTEMGKMVNLRHLEIEGFNLLQSLRGIGRLISLRTLSKFSVGDARSGCKIGELKNLNFLQGKIVIDKLQRVENRDEAMEAELNKKPNLHVLHLCWGDRVVSEGNAMERMESVLEELQPHTNVKELKLVNYIGTKFPSWMEDPLFANLVTVELYDCCKCRQLPAFGKLPSLKYLEIWGMDEISYIGSEFYGNIAQGTMRAFPKLEKLSFVLMSNWEEWELRIDDDVMPSLHHLKIVFCPKLKALPRQLPPAISEVEIEDDGKIVWTPSLPPFLERLIINYKVRSSLRPLPVIPNLKHLKITGLKENESLPDGLGQLEALQALEISYCPMLNSLPKELQHLTALKELRLFECPLLKERYQNVPGEDWRTIAHIPNIWMDDEKIQ